TNRHVIRPEPTASSRENDAKFEQEEDAINRRFDLLKSEKARLKAVKDSLARMQHEVNNPEMYYNPTSAAEYQEYRNSYERDSREYDRLLRETQKMRDDYRARKTSFDRRSANAAIARQFKVTLKDGSKVLAELVSISEDYDL